jgi:hypothetical protein
LRVVERLGLATETAPGAWQLSPELEPTLRCLGERGDIIKALHAEMARAGRGRGAGDYAIYDPEDAVGRPPLVGRVVARGLSDEAEDRHYLIIDGLDGRTHWVDIGRGEAVEAMPAGAVVGISAEPTSARSSDREVAEIAAANGGHYSAALHHRFDPTASPEFVEAHIRRLEALRRARVGPERLPDGSWSVPDDHLPRAEAYEQRQGQRPIRIETLSRLALSEQLAADGATWLDRELIAETPSSVRDAGFGHEVRDALTRRRQWLVEQDLAREELDQTVYRRGLLDVLRRRELNRIAAGLAGELSLDYVEAPASGRIDGIYRRRLDLVSGRFALIEKNREFTLVPWRETLERNIGKPVDGIVRGDSISWTFRRQRGGPSIS